MRILFVEDDNEDIATFNSTLVRFNDEFSVDCEYKNIKSFSDLNDMDLYGFDGAIVDLKLADGSDKGCDVIKTLKNKLSNIPVIVITGTPNNLNNDDLKKYCVAIIKKGAELSYRKALGNLYDIYTAGITKVMGTSGKIREYMADIFINNIMPQLQIWKNYKKENKDTEIILLRHVLSHLYSMLEDKSEAVFEEMYIIPPHNKNIKTGSIIKHKNTGLFYTVLNPECDLVIRSNGKVKTDYVLLCPIEQSFENFNSEIKNQICNYSCDYVYCLPENNLFTDSFLNYRNINSIKYEDCIKNYELKAQITNLFTREITQKFSTYYSRQGQPDLNKSVLKKKICV